MNKFLIDTDIWIDFLNKQEYALDLIPKLSEEGYVFSSVLTIAELRAGFTRERARRFMPIFYAFSNMVVGVSENIAEMAGTFLFEYKKKGISLGIVDTIIATTAIQNSYILLTNNKKHYPMPEITFYTKEEKKK